MYEEFKFVDVRGEAK